MCVWDWNYVLTISTLLFNPLKPYHTKAITALNTHNQTSFHIKQWNTHTHAHIQVRTHLLTHKHQKTKRTKDTYKYWRQSSRCIATASFHGDSSCLQRLAAAQHCFVNWGGEGLIESNICTHTHLQEHTHRGMHSYKITGMHTSHM